MFSYSQSTSRYVWDIYAEIASAGIAERPEWTAEQAAEWAAKFADEMCRQRAVRFPIEEKKAK